MVQSGSIFVVATTGSENGMASSVALNLAASITTIDQASVFHLSTVYMAEISVLVATLVDFFGGLLLGELVGI